MISDHRREQLRQAKQRQRERAREAGLCPTCGQNPSPPDGVTCASCIEKRVEARRGVTKLSGNPSELQPSRRDH